MELNSLKIGLSPFYSYVYHQSERSCIQCGEGLSNAHYNSLNLKDLLNRLVQTQILKLNH